MFANRYTALGLLCMALGACTPQMDAYDAGQMRLVRNTGTVEQNRQSVTVHGRCRRQCSEQDVRSTIQALTLLGDPLTTHAMIEGATSAAPAVGCRALPPELRCAAGQYRFQRHGGTGRRRIPGDVPLHGHAAGMPRLG